MLKESKHHQMSEYDKELYKLALNGSEDEETNLIDQENNLRRLEKVNILLDKLVKKISNRVHSQCPTNQENMKIIMQEIFGADNQNEAIMLFDKLERQKILDDTRFNIEKTIVSGKHYLKK